MEQNSEKVNYLREIISFYLWLEEHPMKANAIALWHALMNQWNRTYWKEDFSPAMQVLLTRCGMSKSSLLRARQELVSAGRLRVFEPDSRGFTRYEILLFHPNPAYSDTLYKQNKAKQSQTKQNQSFGSFSESLPGLRTFRNADGLLVPGSVNRHNTR